MSRNEALSNALEGLVVIDFTTLLPGPYASHLLAEMGARVIRVESPTRPDMLQFVPPVIDGLSAAHRTFHRGKQSLALDLKTNDGVEIAKQCIARADVVIEGFRPGVMARLGLGYDDVKSLNPGLVYCSITGYGQEGELASRAGHDINYLALSGLASYSGRKDTGPVLSGFQIADIAGGSHSAVMAIQAALLKRVVFGEGQYLDISMLDAAVSLNTINGANTLAGTKSPSLGEDLLAGGSVYGYYECKDGRFMSVGSLEPQFLSALVVALDLDQQFDANDPTLLFSVSFKNAVKNAFATKSFEHWCSHFASKDCCVEPVLTIDEAVNSSWAQARRLTTESGHQTQLSSSFISVDATHAPAPDTGRDDEKLLAELGFKVAEIESLRARGIIGR